MDIAVFAHHVGSQGLKPSGQYGGGELLTFGWLSALQKYYNVMTVVPNGVYPAFDSAYEYGIDLSGIDWRPVGDTADWIRKYDCLINISHSSYMPPICQRNIMVTMFPQQPDWDTSGYDTICAISQFSADWIKRYWGREAKVVYPLLPVQDTIDRIEQAGYEKQNNIVAIGRFFNVPWGNNKSHSTLISAFQGMYKGDWALTFVGSVQDQKYLQEVKQAANGDQRIKFFRDLKREQYLELLGKSRFLWHAAGYEATKPSSMEHFGIIAVEAQAAGTQPFVFNGGGIVEIPGVIPWDTPAQLSEYTVVEIEKPTPNPMQENALTFDIERNTERLLEIIEDPQVVVVPKPEQAKIYVGDPHPNDIKVGVISDDPNITTGFGAVSRAVVKGLIKRGFRVAAMGIQNPIVGKTKLVPEDIRRIFGEVVNNPQLPTAKMMTRVFEEKLSELELCTTWRGCSHDPSGFDMIEQFLKIEKPDVLYINYDPGNIRNILNGIQDAHVDIPIVAYVPIEGSPVIPQYIEMLRTIKVMNGEPIVYTYAGQRAVMEAGGPKCRVAHHGCFSGDTLITLSDGSKKRIDRIVADKDHSVLGTHNGNPVISCVYDWMTIPMMDSHILKITFDTGDTLRVTRDNLVFTQDGWIKANDLVVGSRCGIINTSTPHANGDYDAKSKNMDQRRGELVEGQLSYNDSNRFEKVIGENLALNKKKGAKTGLIQGNKKSSQKMDQKRLGLAQVELPLSGSRKDRISLRAKMESNSNSSQENGGSQNKLRRVSKVNRSKAKTNIGRLGLFGWNNRWRRSFDVIKKQSKKWFCFVSKDRGGKSKQGFDGLDSFVSSCLCSLRQWCRIWVGVVLPSADNWVQGNSCIKWYSSIYENKKRKMQDSDFFLRKKNGFGESGTVFRTRFRGLPEDEKTKLKKGFSVSWGVITNIELDHESIVYDLKTSTSNFVANNIVVHNCDHAPFRMLDPETRKQLKIACGWGNKKVMMFVGRNKRTKGFGTLLKTARILKDMGRDDIVWYLHTWVWDQMPNSSMPLDQWAKQYGIADRVMFPEIQHQVYGIPYDEPATHPHIDENELAQMSEQDAARKLARIAFNSLSLIERYGIATAFINASEVEGHGLTYLEAMGCGVPVISVDDQGVQQEVIGDAALYVPVKHWDDFHTGARLAQGDPQDFARAIIDLVDNQDLYNEMQQKALERYQQFKWDKTIDIIAKAIIERYVV
jgi:glycosyltransferase involved in cell wall biosynthesis